MNSHNNDNSLSKFGSDDYLKVNSTLSKIKSKSSSQIIFHKILNSLNLSIILLIFILSFLAFDSQRKWTDFYSSLKEIKIINNNLIDFISITEENYINGIESIDSIKKTTSEDLIYLDKPIRFKKRNLFYISFNNLLTGLKNSSYKRGY